MSKEETGEAAMMSVIEYLSRKYPDVAIDPGLKEIIDRSKKQEGMTMMGQKEEIEEMGGGKGKCWLAMKAAWDTLAEYCGGSGVPLEMEGMSLTVPVDVIETARTHPDMSRDERIQLVADTEWCRKTAMNMCEQLFDAKRGTDDHPECIKNVAKRIAAKIVD